LALDDDYGNLLTLELLTASETQAGHLAEHFRAHPEQVYNGVLDVLLTDSKKE
jgi:predicted component of type VI protein secretion system